MKEVTSETEYEIIRKQSSRSMNKLMIIIFALSIPLAFLFMNYLDNTKSATYTVSESNINWLKLLIFICIAVVIFIAFKITVQIRYRKKIQATVKEYRNGNMTAKSNLLKLIVEEKHRRAIYLPEARPYSHRDYKEEVNQLKIYEDKLVNKQIIADKQIQKLEDLLLVH